VGALSLMVGSRCAAGKRDATPATRTVPLFRQRARGALRVRPLPERFYRAVNYGDV